MKILPAALALLLLLSVASAASGEAEVQTREIRQEGSSVIIEWTMKKEVAVREYEVFRHTPYNDGQATQVKVVRAHGEQRAYRVVDDQVYKQDASEQLKYSLVAVGLDGTRKELFSEPVNYISTAARRTWGSIKAMFQ